MPTEVEVVVSIAGEDVPAGRLWAHRSRGRESATFSYAEAYLARRDAYELDPRLPLVGGPQQTAAGRAERSIGEIDYLLGVRDDLRQGALRFRDPESGVHLAAEPEGVPDLVELPRLLTAAERLERDEIDDPELGVGRPHLAARAGIEVPESSLHRIDGRSVLIVDRFDRAGDVRIPYGAGLRARAGRSGPSVRPGGGVAA